jgi:subtilisin family serine protease
VAAACLGATLGAATPEARTAAQTRYVVLYQPNASPASAKAAIAAAGGHILRVNWRVGVVSANPDFRDRAASTAAVEGVAQDRVIGSARKPMPKFSEETMRELRDATKGLKLGSPADKVRRGGGNGVEPLAPLQWDMKMIHATADGSYAKERGSKDVLVGIIDTGIDGSHPDIAPNFSRSLSRNFTTDIPLIDGPCRRARSLVLRPRRRGRERARHPRRERDWHRSSAVDGHSGGVSALFLALLSQVGLV